MTARRQGLAKIWWRAIPHAGTGSGPASFRPVDSGVLPVERIAFRRGSLHEDFLARRRALDDSRLPPKSRIGPAGPLPAWHVWFPASMAIGYVPWEAQISNLGC